MTVEPDTAAAGVARQPERQAAEALQELREQFEAYRREKGENDALMSRQLEEMREQASTLRLDNAKLASKVTM